MNEPHQEVPVWVTVSSFFPPPAPEPDFEAIVTSEMTRWTEAAKDAGLPPQAHVRIRRGAQEVAIEISAELDRAFTPEQPFWKAL